MQRTLRFRFISPFFAAQLLWGTFAAAQVATDMLPDVVVDPTALYDNRIDTETFPGRRLLRLTTSTPNIGDGPLEIRGSSVLDGSRQTVLQRIYRSDGSFWDRSAGTSVYHPTHGHTHFEGWAVYRLRAVGPGGSVGDVVALGDKTSFCLLDITTYDDVASGTPPGPPRYQSCGQAVQGISPGWADVYDRELDDQWIDITGVPDGAYWLEAEVDPDSGLLETPGGESNNIARIQVVLGEGPPIEPDSYEPNDSLTDAADLGLITSRLELTGLSMEAGADFYRFRLDRMLDSGAHVLIDSPHAAGLELFLLDASGNLERTAEHDLGILSLADLPAGTYHLLVVPYAAENPEYELAIDPAANLAPEIEIVYPADHSPWVEHAYEALPVEWIASDPENDRMTVALFVDRNEVVDEGTYALGGYQALSAEAGVALINTAAIDIGTWFLLARVTDGGGWSSSWARRPFVVYEKGDLNFDGHADRKDWVMLAQRRRAYRDLTLGQSIFGWERLLDMDRDADVDDQDLTLFRSLALANHAAHEH